MGMSQPLLKLPGFGDLGRDFDVPGTRGRRAPFGNRRTRRDQPLLLPALVRGCLGVPANINAHTIQKLIELGTVRQRLGLGIPASQTVSNLLDAEATLAFAQSQTAQCSDAQPQGPFGRHPTWVKLLPGRHGGRLTHRRRQIQQPLVAEGLAAVWLLRLRHLVKFLEDPQRRRQGIVCGESIGHLSQLFGEGSQFLRAGDDDLATDPPHLESPLGHHVFGFDRRPCHGRSHALLTGDFHRIGGGT